VIGIILVCHWQLKLQMLLLLTQVSRFEQARDTYRYTHSHNLFDGHVVIFYVSVNMHLDC